MIAPAPQSKPNTAVATSVGANYFRFKVFNYLDKVITLNPQLSIEIKDPVDAKPFEEHLRKIAQATDSKNIPVYVTSAGPVEIDRVVLPFFKNPKYKNNDYERNPYLPHKSIPEMLAKAELPIDKFKLDFGNDTQMNIKYAIKNFRQHLKPGNTIYHFITGQGLGGGSARVAADYNSTGYLCKEPGHQAMPGIEENLILEGEGRKNRLDPVTKIKGASEPYCAGGNENDSETGPKATVYNLLKLFNADKAKFQAAIDLLNKKTSSNISAEIFTASPLFELAKSNKLTTFEIGEKAKVGDAFAQAILTYTAGRLADFMINLIKTEGRISEQSPLGLISYSGGLSQSFHDKCPKAWKQLEMRLTEALGPGAKLVLCRPEEGFDGTIELAKFTLGESEANKETKTSEKQAETKVGFFRSIINWIKSLFGFKT